MCLQVFFETQSMSQQRQATPLQPGTRDAPDRVFVIIPGCSNGPQGSCPWVDFRQMVLWSIDKDCVPEGPLAAWVDSLISWR